MKNRYDRWAKEWKLMARGVAEAILESAARLPRSPTEGQDDRMVTAYHEAGHLIVDREIRLTGDAPLRATIQDAGGVFVGKSEWVKVPWKDIEKTAPGYVACFLAGDLGEQFYKQRKIDYATDDRVFVFRILKCVPPALKMLTYERGNAWAKQILNEHVDELHAVAAKLYASGAVEISALTAVEGA